MCRTWPWTTGRSTPALLPVAPPLHEGGAGEDGNRGHPLWPRLAPSDLHLGFSHLAQGHPDGGPSCPQKSESLRYKGEER